MFKNLLPLMLGALVLSPSYAQAANPGVSALPERSQIPLRVHAARVAAVKAVLGEGAANEGGAGG